MNARRQRARLAAVRIALAAALFQAIGLSLVALAHEHVASCCCESDEAAGSVECPHCHSTSYQLGPGGAPEPAEDDDCHAAGRVAARAQPDGERQDDGQHEGDVSPSPTLRGPCGCQHERPPVEGPRARPALAPPDVRLLAPSEQGVEACAPRSPVPSPFVEPIWHVPIEAAFALD